MQIDCRYCRYCRYYNIRTEPASRARTIILQVSSGQVSDRIFPPRLACELAICQPGPGCAISESSRRGGLCALVTERYTVHIMRAICIYTVTAIQPSFARSLSFFFVARPQTFFRVGTNCRGTRGPHVFVLHIYPARWGSRVCDGWISGSWIR